MSPSVAKAMIRFYQRLYELDREKRTQHMITPTVGRIVWYHPHTEDAELRGFSQTHDGRPLAGIVVNVWSDTCVNLAVFDPNGKSYSRTSVFLYQGDSDRPSSSYAEWMPYQKGQAAKTEALEKQVALPCPE